jgi:hypothetical protein
MDTIMLKPRGFMNIKRYSHQKEGKCSFKEISILVITETKSYYAWFIQITFYSFSSNIDAISLLERRAMSSMRTLWVPIHVGCDDYFLHCLWMLPHQPMIHGMKSQVLSTVLYRSHQQNLRWRLLLFCTSCTWGKGYS